MSLPNASVAVTVIADGPTGTGAVTTATTAAAAATLGTTSAITTGLCMLSVGGPRTIKEVVYAYLCGDGLRGASGRQL